ncbi:MAG: hypothetical protein MZV70_49755 [Desulfobacterales bacterium]|nr:hypothetical protein [Desulfobacterales bacterium]
MLELIKMIVVLTIISLASGGLLAALRDGTQERIDNQVLEFVKGPAVRTGLRRRGERPHRQPFSAEGRRYAAKLLRRRFRRRGQGPRA